MRNAGKGMGPKKGYNQKNYSDNYDRIDWSNKPEITVSLPGNITGYFPVEEKKDKKNVKSSNT
jgi:hypothetical protein